QSLTGPWSTSEISPQSHSPRVQSPPPPIIFLSPTKVSLTSKVFHYKGKKGIPKMQKCFTRTDG
uniref:Uncharacterized protein n=1 Tax=Sus scrofa TaxID=9823 RepID=A0A8D1CXU6_PIG